MLLCFSLVLADTAALADTGVDTGGEPPVADAGVGLLANVGDAVVLNANASADPEGETLSFEWTQSGGPPTALTKKNTAEPELTVEAAGTLRYTLVVSDGVLDSEPDTVEIVVPERQFGGDAEGACASVNAPAWLALLPAFAAWTRRRA